MIVFVTLCGAWLVVGVTLLVRGPIDGFTLAPVLGVSGMWFLAVADLLREPASNAAVLLRLASGLIVLAGVATFAAGIYLSAGTLWALVFAGFAVLAISLAFYLQQRPDV